MRFTIDINRRRGTYLFHRWWTLFMNSEIRKNLNGGYPNLFNYRGIKWDFRLAWGRELKKKPPYHARSSSNSIFKIRKETDEYKRQSGKI